MLTREQVEKLKPLASLDRRVVNLGGLGRHVGVYTALALMIDQDAALRDALFEAQQAALREGVVSGELRDALARQEHDLTHPDGALVQAQVAYAKETLKLAALQTQYNDLIMQVGRKYVNESRHETAKRYIQRAEVDISGAAQQALGKEAI